jgi:hypothetical protein
MNRFPFAPLLLAGGVLLGGCFDLSNSAVGSLRLSPILDSMFVGDTLSPLTVSYFDADGVQRSPGPITWHATVDSVGGVPAPIVTIDGLTGKIVGRRRGATVVYADAQNLLAPALIVVSSRLDLTLLLDTVFVMPTDTITLPLAIVQRPGSPPATQWFSPTPDSARYTIDTATGLVRAFQTGAALAYIAHAAAGQDTVADTGAVVVMTLGSPSGGRFFASVMGISIRHEGGAAAALNYQNTTTGKLAFRLVDSIGSRTSTTFERLMITLRDSVVDIGRFDIDTLNPQEATGRLDAVCNPPRSWAVWSSGVGSQILAFSHSPFDFASAGEIAVTQYRVIPGGFVISGRYTFTAQRYDLYSDPLGQLTIHGSFVAPLVNYSTSCEQ